MGANAPSGGGLAPTGPAGPGALGTTPVTGGMAPSGGVANGEAPPMNISYSTQGGAWPTDPATGQPAATSPMPAGSFKPQFIVWHTTEGNSFNGAASYDQTGDGVPDGSTNYVIDKDGTVYTIVEPGSAMPWANGQGDGGGLNYDNAALVEASQQGNLNNQSISIEIVSANGDPPTPEQIAAGQQLTAYLSGQYGIPIDDQHMVGHADIDSRDRQDPYTSYNPMDMAPTGGVAPVGPAGPGALGTAPVTGQYSVDGSMSAQGQAGQYPVTAAADGASPPENSRMPIVSDHVTPQATPTLAPATNGTLQGDGMGIMSTSDSDESAWIGTMFPNGGGYVSTDYKQNVCTYDPGCCEGGECMYASNELYLQGASQTVHPGYDVGAEYGSTYHAPIGGEIIGTSNVASDPRCMSPGGTNECTWAGDYGVVQDGGVDANGNPIYINYDHTISGTGDHLVGQYVEPGAPIGQVDDPGGGPHIHVEVHGYCDQTGGMVVLDPTLVYEGYYQTHSVCEGHV
jgi:hypothetical protein